LTWSDPSLTRLLRLGILAEGYIYPKEWRPVRDLLRKRGHLVRLRTSLINSFQGIISRNCGFQLPGKKIKQVRVNHITPLLASQEDLAMTLSFCHSKKCFKQLYFE
jgi:hypothetical protein